MDPGGYFITQLVTWEKGFVNPPMFTNAFTNGPTFIGY